MKNINKLFGICLLTSKATASNIIRSIDENWLVGDFQHKVYKAMLNLANGSSDINVLTLVNTMKEQGLEKDYMLKISNLTSGVTHVDITNVNALIHAIDLEYREARSLKVLNELSIMMSSGLWSIDKMRELMNSGLSLCDFQVVKDESNIQTIFHLIDKHNLAKQGDLGGIKLPYRALDEVVLLEDVDLMVIGARPAMGKTAFVVSTAVKMALSGRKVIIFALEMSRLQMMRRIVAHLTAIDSNVIKYGHCNAYQMEMINRVQELPELENIIIVEGSQSVTDIYRAIQSHKPDVAFVDYLQKIKSEHSDPYVAVTKASNGLKEICQNLHTPIIAMAQLSRPDAHKVGKRPSLPDLRQSGEIEQDASIVGFIHRPEYYGEDSLSDGSPAQDVAEFIIAKNREGEVGVYNMRVNLKISKFMDSNSTPAMSGGSANPF